MWFRSLSGMVACVCLLVSFPARAHADSTIRRDARDDARAGFDITRVKYRHAPKFVAARVRVPDLREQGRVLLRTTRFEVFEAGYIAVIKKRDNGSLAKRLLYFDHFDTHPRRCDVDGKWKSRVGVVQVSVPRSCLDKHRQPRLYVDAIAAIGRRFDSAPAVRQLSRG